ncbi:MAG: LPS-assembly protein LptD [bacterium]
MTLKTGISDTKVRQQPRKKSAAKAFITPAHIAMIAALCGTSWVTSIAAAERAPEVIKEDDDTVLFEADIVIRSAADAPIIAQGKVNAYFGKRYLVSDKVVYDPQTKIVTAIGNVAITDEDGQTYFADEVELTDDLADGVATNFSALLANDAKLAGRTVVKRGDSSNELTNAVYSACAVCNDDNSKKTPTWQVKAAKVTQDNEEKIIRFNNAVFEAFGVPILYTPYLQIPDPSVKRQSGLLAPTIGTSDRLGAYIDLPYYIAISDTQDATFSPKFMSDQGTLLKGEYRFNTRNGSFIFQPGIISAADDNLVIARTGAPDTILPLPDIRFHFFSKGEQKLNDLWTARFDVDYVSDKEYLRNYDVKPEGDLQEPAGLYRPDRLKSSIGLARRTQNSLLTIDGLGFQSLRRADDNDYSAQALPRIKYQAEFDMPGIGGKLGIDSSLLYLTRLDGANSLRAIASANWQKLMTTKSGHRLRFFGELRGDSYHYDNLSNGTEFCFLPDNATVTQTTAFNNCQALLPGGGQVDRLDTTRFLPTLGAEWSFPVAKQTKDATIILEPKVQYVVSPDKDFSGDILNEDSQFLELDSSSLFDWNKSPGYDLWEDGERLNVGLSGAAFFNNGFALEAGIGQQFRQEKTNAFSGFGLNPGLGDLSSDIIGTLDIRWGRNLSFENELRIDKDDGTVRRAESSFKGRYGRFTSNLDYIKVQTGDLANGGEIDEYRFTSLTYDINENWRIGGRIREDLVGPVIGTDVNGQDIRNPGITQEMLQIGYTDECTHIFLAFRNDKTAVEGFDSDKSLSINVELTGFNK